jgi:IS30 family transposase
MPQLSLSQRYTIEALSRLGYGVSEIAERTDILKCTVSRELSRNSKNGRYDALAAEKMKNKRRQRGAYKMRDALLGQVEAMLVLRYSPEQIAGRLKQQQMAAVSHETIYTYIYRNKMKGGHWYKYLRLGHKRRRKRLLQRDRRGVIPNKVMIAQRPLDVENKVRFGDWEGDTIIGGGHQGVIVTLVERKTKYTLMAKAENKSAAVVEQVVVDLLKNCPIERKTITFDNGTEFTNHQTIAQALGVDIYFANPYHSWERGLNENTNGLIRQFIPKKQNIQQLDEKYVQAVQENLNHRPRKSLGYLSPIEFYNSATSNINPVAFQT